MRNVMKCPKCHSEAPSGSKFCLECGTKLPPPDAADTRPASISLGDKNVVGGDLVGTKQEVKVLGGSYTNITHSDETRKTRTCAISGRIAAVTEGHECPACKRWVVTDHFIKQQLRCTECNQKQHSQREREYEARLHDAYLDKRVDDGDRQQLKKLAAELGITEARAQELERPYRQTAESSSLDEAERIRLKQAEKLLYSDFKVDEAHPIIQRLYDAYTRRVQSIWQLYMTSLTEFDPDAALQLFESLDVDEPAVYLHRLEIKARQGPRGLDEAGKLIKLAQQKFPDAQDWSMMQAECHMEEFRQTRDAVWLEQADKCLRHDRMPDEWLWVKAKLDYLQNRDRDALNRLKEKLIPGTLPYYRVVRAQKYLQVGSMKLIMRGEEYPCRSGDVIGRHGTVATGVMSMINTLSRRHAQVVLRAGQWHIKVLATTNASTLNGKPIEAGRFYLLGLEQTVRLSTQCEFELRTTISH